MFSFFLAGVCPFSSITPSWKTIYEEGGREGGRALVGNEGEWSVKKSPREGRREGRRTTHHEPTYLLTGRDPVLLLNHRLQATNGRVGLLSKKGREGGEGGREGRAGTTYLLARGDLILLLNPRLEAANGRAGLLAKIDVVQLEGHPEINH